MPIATQDKYDDAIDAYDQRDKDHRHARQKRDWPLFYARAMAEDQAKHWDKAEADVKTALKLSPDQPELLNYLGYSWVDQGRANSRSPDHAGKGALAAPL